MIGSTTNSVATTYRLAHGLRTHMHLHGRFLGLLILALLCSYPLFNLITRNTTDIAAIPAEANRQQHVLNALTMGFEKNLGQTDLDVAYITRAPGYTLFLASDQATIRLHSSAENTDQTQQNTIQMRFVGATENIELEGLKKLPGRINYLHGTDNWQKNIPRYQQILASNVYPGIDVVYYGSQNQQLEYDLRVAPGADPKQIKIAYQGADSLAVDKAGNLLINLSGGQLRQLKPVIYQIVNDQRQPVEGRYLKTDNHTIAIEVATYDQHLALIIDPVLEYASYLGGSKDDSGLAIAVDDQGAIYIAGSTQSLNFPVAQPLETDQQGKGDIFVAKLTPQGDALEYATYIGGSKLDQANAMVLDDVGNVYLAGVTQSNSDFPLH